MTGYETNGNGVTLTRAQIASIAAAAEDAEGDGDIHIGHDASGKLRVSVEETVTRLRPLALGAYRRTGGEQ